MVPARANTAALAARLALGPGSFIATFGAQVEVIPSPSAICKAEHDGHDNRSVGIILLLGFEKCVFDRVQFTLGVERRPQTLTLCVYLRLHHVAHSYFLFHFSLWAPTRVGVIDNLPNFWDINCKVDSTAAII